MAFVEISLIKMSEQLRMGCISSASDNHDNDSLPASTSDSSDGHHSIESTSTQSEPYPWIKSTTTQYEPYPRINLTHDQANGNLKRYLDDLLNRELAFPIPEAEVCDIRDAVEKIVRRILAEVEKLDDHVKVMEILKVGSFYDGTKICYPDEFDFLVVLEWECLADGRNIEFRSIYDHDDSDYMYIQEVDDGRYVHGIYTAFYYHVKESVNRLGKKNMHKVVMSHGKLKITNDGDVYDEAVDKNGPATTLHLHWNDSHQIHNISIDITTAIRTNNVQNVSDLHVNMVQYEKFYQTPLCNGALLLIKKHNDILFKIAFTETEATIVKSQFSQKHRDVLKLLKYLYPVDGPWASPTISSYLLKLTVINHHYTCSYDESDSISHCLINVLQDVLDHFMVLVDKPPGIDVERVERDILNQVYTRYLDRYRDNKEFGDKLIKNLKDLLVIADNKMSYSFEACSVSRINPHYQIEL